MEKLNLPHFDFKIKTVAQSKQIFDEVRKKFVVLTPEEWVRQNFTKYLVSVLKYPNTLLSLEHNLTYNNLNKRGDIVCFSKKGTPFLIVECKRPSVAITQKTFDQIVRYNAILQVPLLVVTNGLSHYCCFVNKQENKVQFLEEIPNFETAIKYS